MPSPKHPKRKISYSRSYYEVWPEDAYAILSETVERYSRRYKYVRYGITTDFKSQYDVHFRHDDISWQKMHVRYRTEDIRTIKKLIESCSQDENYIDNNIHFPETLFDKRSTYYVYALVGKRKKSQNAIKQRRYTFVELASELGGFDIALTRLGCTRVSADEKNEFPQHDILCASIPEEEYSLQSISQIIRAQGKDRPKYLFFETAANIKVVDEGHVWNTIHEGLTGLGYDVRTEILSPHQFGLPQHRQRTYIVGIRSDIREYTRFSFPVPNNKPCDIHSIIDVTPSCKGESEAGSIQTLTLKQHKILKVWQQFLDGCREHKVPVPKFPVWAMEFGVTTPYKSLPKWKKYCVSKNRQFYADNKEWLDNWLEDIKPFESTYQKLEWHVGDDGSSDIKDNIIQFLASGVRVKSPTFSPSLSGTLLPIIPWATLPAESIPQHTQEDLAQYGLTEEDITHGRYLTVHEVAKLQGYDISHIEGLSTSRVTEALGNAVNVHVVERIAKELL